VRPLAIAHISDLHISAQHTLRNVTNARRVLEYIARLGVDHVVITGDIVANADPEDYRVARKILDSFGLLDPSRLSVVIGNHDIFGGVHVAEDLLTFPRRCRETDYGRTVDLFREYFREAFRNCFFVSPLSPFPYAKVVGDVLLIGANTVAPYSRFGNPLGSNGEIRGSQWSQLQRIVASDVFRNRRKVVLLHHHFSKQKHHQARGSNSVWNVVEAQTMKLRGKEPIMRLFRDNGVDAVLHGHVHESMEYTRKGIRFMNAGGATLGPDPSMLSVNVLRVGPRGTEAEIHAIPAAGARSRLQQVPVEEAASPIAA
jgi:3',5'-cyclic AMP phosphodiesterase CpdA